MPSDSHFVTVRVEVKAPNGAILYTFAKDDCYVPSCYTVETCIDGRVISTAQINEPTIKAGSKWRRTDVEGEDIYLLAQVDPLAMALIDIKTGWRWTDPVPVQTAGKPTAHEWARILSSGEFERVE